MGSHEGRCGVADVAEAQAHSGRAARAEQEVGQPLDVLQEEVLLVPRERHQRWQYCVPHRPPRRLLAVHLHVHLRSRSAITG